MAFAHAFVAPHAQAYGGERKRGLFRRLLDAIMEARLRNAEREIGRYLAATGGKFTDETEREIERRILTSGW